MGLVCDIMPFEDDQAGKWKSVWTEMCLREMSTLGENQKRMEDKHENRMDRIEKSIDDMAINNSAEFSKLYNKIDDVAGKLNELIKETKDRHDTADNYHAVDIAKIKTTLHYYTALVMTAFSGLVVWLIGWVLPGKGG